MLVLLLTPAHINLLNHAEGFVPKLLRHLFNSPACGQNFDVLAAVIDRIPHPTTDGSANQASDPSTSFDTDARASFPDGSEGLSCVVLDSGSAAPDLWSLRPQSNERETMTIQQRCTLSFVFAPTNLHLSLPSTDVDVRQSIVSRTLQLPVANTLFQNGKTSTLSAQRWQMQPSEGGADALTCVQETYVPEQTLCMSSVFHNTGPEIIESLDSHLLPITPMRRVSAAIGNIIRRLSAENPAHPDTFASEELEKSISNAIKEGRIPAEQTGIWALVEPSSHAALRKHSRVGMSDDSYQIQRAVLDGCRLHKVLSGGGGWGEKQGLLALDPDSTYSGNQQMNGFDSDSDSDLFGDNIQGLDQIVTPGDHVRFYIYRPPPHSGVPPPPSLKECSTGTSAAQTIKFGSLPSTMDSMPSSLDNVTSGFKTENAIIQGHFGMLSEQGMSLKVRAPLDRAQANLNFITVLLRQDRQACK